MLIAGLFVIPGVSAADATVCCEKTTSGFYCQDVPADECAPGEQQVPTACESTSYCKPGVCYNSNDGTCSDNTAQITCNNAGGSWSVESQAQCELGCCVLGDQASFVTLVRCKQLSGFLGLQTNYNPGISDEVSCVLSVQNQDKGACVFESEFERNCEFTTRSECSATAGSEFHKDTLCSAETLGTICGPTDDTVCVPGKDEVYFVDTCGNAANIYNSAMIWKEGSDNKDLIEYWSKVKDKTESCNPSDANSNSNSCGNCNYLLGSICRSSDFGGRASYGDNICVDLNCDNGKKHGESWCVNADEGEVNSGDNAVGSRFFKHICINGEEVVEPCADFRQEVCIEDKIETSLGDFSQAACRVNRWQDCTAQGAKDDCENTDRRDCQWIAGVELQLEGAGGGNGACLPLNTPGIDFWEGEGSLAICSQGNAACVVTFEKKIVGGEKCVDNCECLEGSWVSDRNNVCVALGDCGPKINWVGQEGYKKGYEVIRS